MAPHLCGQLSSPAVSLLKSIRIEETLIDLVVCPVQGFEIEAAKIPSAFLRSPLFLNSCLPKAFPPLEKPE